MAEFARIAKGLDDIAPPLGTGAAGGELPAAVAADMARVAEAARAVLHAAEPDGDAGAVALSAAVADAANDVVRHLVTAAGGRQEGPGRMVLEPPATVAFAADAKDSQPNPHGRNRTELGKIEAREGLQGALYGEVAHFTYVALLAHPRTRAALAPRLSPGDLPAEVPDLNLPVANREEWQEDIFDDRGRLVVPSSFDPVRWRSFIGWAETVNPLLREAVADLTGPALLRIK